MAFHCPSEIRHNAELTGAPLLARPIGRRVMRRLNHLRFFLIGSGNEVTCSIQSFTQSRKIFTSFRMGFDKMT